MKKEKDERGGYRRHFAITLYVVGLLRGSSWNYFNHNTAAAIAVLLTVTTGSWQSHGLQLKNHSLWYEPPNGLPASARYYVLMVQTATQKKVSDNYYALRGIGPLH